MRISRFCVIGLSILTLTVASITSVAQEVKIDDKIIIEGKTYYLHKVQKAEGLYRISVNYGVSQKELLEANPSAAFGLKEGQLLKVPVIKGRNSTGDELRATDYVYHTVEKGQTVFYLSRKYNVLRETIYENNPGSDQQLLLGTMIKIPREKIGELLPKDDKKEEFIYHTVRPQETMYALKTQYNLEISEIVKHNPALESGILPIGSVVRIPFKQKSEQAVVVEGSTDEKVEDELYLYHRIAAGETLYSIAAQYRAKAQDVEQANSAVNPDDLPIGYLVRIPKASLKTGFEKTVTGKDGLFMLHKVKRKETIFAISKRYNVDIDILEKVNTNIDLGKLKKGTTVQIPTQEWFEQYFMRHVKEEVVDEGSTENLHDWKAATCGTYDYNQEKPLLRVAMLLPFAVEDSRKVNIITEEKDGESIEKEREEKIISYKSKVFVEFYQGALLALDSLKKEGVNVELFVYDTAPDSNKVNTILAKPEMAYMNLIIGPAYPQNLKAVSSFAMEHDIPVVYPFSTRNYELVNNPKLFQVSPVDTLLFKEMSQEMIPQIEGKRVVMIRTENGSSAYENQYSEMLKKKIYLESFKKGEHPDFVEYKFKQDDLASLERMLSMEKENVVIIPSIEEAQVNRIVTTVKGAAEKTKAAVTLWGQPEWLKFQTINPQDIHQLNGKIFSYYAVNYSDMRNQNVVSKYRKWFKSEPMAISPYFQNASVQSNFSRYSLWGYDVTYYFMSAMKNYGKQFEHCLQVHQPHSVQANFHFKRISNWGGFYNTGLFILHFTTDYQMNIQPIEQTSDPMPDQPILNGSVM